MNIFTSIINYILKIISIAYHFFFLKSMSTSEFIIASFDSLMPPDDTSLSSNAEPIELLSKSDDFWDYLNLLKSIREPFSSTFFFFLPRFDSPSFALDNYDKPSTDNDMSSTLYVLIGLPIAPFGNLFIYIFTSLSYLLSYFSNAEVMETASLI